MMDGVGMPSDLPKKFFYHEKVIILLDPKGVKLSIPIPIIGVN